MSTREPTIEDQLAGITPKGRVERNHAVYQGCFVKEMRLAGICTIEAANKCLAETCLLKINAKSARPPAKSEDAHVPLPNADLREGICFEEERTVSPASA